MPDIAQIRADIEERIALNEDENIRLKAGLAAMKQKPIIAQVKPKRKYTKRKPTTVKPLAGGIPTEVDPPKRGPGRQKKAA